MFYFIVAIIIFIIDQLSKLAVVRYMEIGESIPLWEGVFHLTSHRNAGAAFGILQNQRLFFIVITTFVVLGIVYYILRIKNHQRLTALAMAIILGGVLGNFADRLFTGEVVDFFYFKLINFPIFNVADSAINIGVGLMILDILLDMKINRSKKPNL